MKNRESIESKYLSVAVLGCSLAAASFVPAAYAAGETQEVQIQPIKNNERKQVSMVVTEVGRNNPFEPVFGGYDEDTLKKLADAQNGLGSYLSRIKPKYETKH